jgi:acyl-coenzyme A thioesterase PaaI-like protein
MRKIEQSVFPRWERLSTELGFDQAFEHFAPYVGANVKIRTIDDNTVESSMALIESNTNYVGTHFGGSLYSMCDPFFMFILMENLGKDYIVWDKAASIEFLKPGTGRVTARFHIPAEELDALKTELAKVRKLDRIYQCEVKDEAGVVVAKMTKTLYIRLMKKS